MNSVTSLGARPMRPIKTISRADEVEHFSRLESLGRLAAGVAHEINTPMQYIGDNLSYLSTCLNRLNPELDKLLAIADSWTSTREAKFAGERLGDLDLQRIRAAQKALPEAVHDALVGVASVTKIVRAMKQFAHPGSDKRMGTDINQLLQTAIAISKNEYKRVADIELELADELPQVEVYGAAITQSLINLINNAAHAIEVRLNGVEAKGRILIRTEASEGGVAIVICDDGCGIPDADLSKIFEPFFTTKPQGVGTGQGLPFVRETIETQHGGRIQVSSVWQSGTTIRLWIPRFEASRPA